MGKDDRGPTDWRAWHAKYDDPAHPLASRLVLTARRVGQTTPARWKAAEMPMITGTEAKVEMKIVSLERVRARS